MLLDDLDDVVLGGARRLRLLDDDRVVPPGPWSRCWWAGPGALDGLGPTGPPPVHDLRRDLADVGVAVAAEHEVEDVEDEEHAADGAEDDACDGAGRGA